MTTYNEILSKLNSFQDNYNTKFDKDLEDVCMCVVKFEDEFRNEKNSSRKPKEKNTLTTLQNINEDEDETGDIPKVNGTSNSTSKDSNDAQSNGHQQKSKKRSKNEVDDILSPEQDKRLKRSASVKAQGIIAKQANETANVLKETLIIMDTSKCGVNVNLSQKMRRDEPAEKTRGRQKGREREEDKENLLPVPLVQVKQEKISLPAEPMETELLNTHVKVEDEVVMPPPAAPVPKPRKAVKKENSAESTDDESGGRTRRTTRTKKQADTLPESRNAPQKVNSESSTDEESSGGGRRRATRAKQTDTMPPPPPPEPRKAPQKKNSEESTDDESSGGGRRRATRTRKQTDTMPPPPPPAVGPRATRASSRASRAARQVDEEPAPPLDARPKRTRAKKKAESSNVDAEKETQTPQENGIGSPAEKPRPKRTRRLQKDTPVDKEDVPKPIEPEQTPVEPKLPLPEEQRISQPEAVQSPIIQTKINKKTNNRTKLYDEVDSQSKTAVINDEAIAIETNVKDLALHETRIIPKDSNVGMDMDKTVVLPNGLYNHMPAMVKNEANVNETVVLESRVRETMVLDKPTRAVDTTVVIDKNPAAQRVTDDNSLLTNDSDDAYTPPKQAAPTKQPPSAVKEKVQQFEELASRVTRTKTRAKAKKEQSTDNQTPPDNNKPGLSADTLTKMNSLIFNGKTSQISTSASKPRAIPQLITRAPASASKLSNVRSREEDQRSEREDARRKKEALLEAKREQQKRKREEKMAAAAAAREQAEKERVKAMEMAARERLEKQAHAQQGKLERQREAERKKLELARKVAETEERRRAEELARQQRLAEEQRRADEARRRQLEEAEAMKKEAALMAREIEKRQKEYIEKQKLKQRLEGDKNTSIYKTPGTPGGRAPPPPPEPVYMQDGFQYLDSDEDADPPPMPVPHWSTSKSRKEVLHIQARVATRHVDLLFRIREQTPDLREIFPTIERSRLKRTSSAVWRTPPARLPALQE